MKKAFTLIELLLIITIIAILAGVSLPYVQEYIEQTRQAKAKTDLDEIIKALILYESREGEYNKNKDGVINTTDIYTTNNMISEGGYNIWADFNQDGILNVSDISLIVDCILGNIGTNSLKDPNFKGKIYITTASHTLVLPLKTGAPLINGKYFIPGQAKISIKENHNLIKDNSYPNPNYCIFNQKVTILAK